MILSHILTEVGKDNSGATAVEYGLIISLVVIACITAMSSAAGETSGMWTMINNRTAAALE